ncbi:hypothetical protein GCM10010521_22670 [Streptomyces rameus]|uniref:Uncharacterized protein n=1 Tax=Streptomyces rameus TaxID=68261 RepID=A0ABP6N499_9ACTN
MTAVIGTSSTRAPCDRQAAVAVPHQAGPHRRYRRCRHHRRCRLPCRQAQDNALPRVLLASGRHQEATGNGFDQAGQPFATTADPTRCWTAAETAHLCDAGIGAARA